MPECAGSSVGFLRGSSTVSRSYGVSAGLHAHPQPRMAAAISGVRPRYHMQRNRSDVRHTPRRSATARLISTESAIRTLTLRSSRHTLLQSLGCGLRVRSHRYLRGSYCPGACSPRRADQFDLARISASRRNTSAAPVSRPGCTPPALRWRARSAPAPAGQTPACPPGPASPGLERSFEQPGRGPGRQMTVAVSRVCCARCHSHRVRARDFRT